MNQTFSKTAHRDATRATNALKPRAFVAKLLFRSFHQVSSRTDERRRRDRDEADAWMMVLARPRASTAERRARRRARKSGTINRESLLSCVRTRARGPIRGIERRVSLCSVRSEEGRARPQIRRDDSALGGREDGPVGLDWRAVACASIRLSTRAFRRRDWARTGRGCTR